MRNFAYLGMLVIFVSMLLMLFLFDSFTRTAALCQAVGCDRISLFLSMLFGLFIAGVFVVIDSIAGCIIIREKAWEPEYAYKKMASKDIVREVSELEKRCSDLRRAKSVAEKQYYKGKFDTETFKGMLRGYEHEMIEARSKIRGMRARPRRKGGRVGR